jgi:pimeloyl-ACP methyl ester carboxylesterase
MNPAKWALSPLIALILLPAAAVAQRPEMPTGWSDGYVYANGIRIHYYQAVSAPEKPVMMMVHGITDNGLCWTTLAQKLQNSYDIYMVDIRGHGLSDPFTPSDDGSTLVKDVAAFVHAMDLEKPVLIGHSMGAATVMRVGAEYPELAKAIILLDPFLNPEGPRRRDAAKRSKAEQGDKRATPPSTPKHEPPAPDHLLVSMFGTPDMLVAQNNYRFDDLVATCRRQTPKWSMADCRYWALSKKQYHGAHTNEAWQVMAGTMKIGDSLAKIPVPTLILKADAPPEVRKANEKAASVMRKGRLLHIDGAGHNLHHDELERTVEILSEFLSTSL